MLPTPPDCGAPCAMCESYAHLLAKAREEIARLREDNVRCGRSLLPNAEVSRARASDGTVPSVPHTIENP